MTDQQPRILGGRYQLGQVIGRGGMALVSRARDLRLGRDVAVKELRVDLAGDSTFQERFRREAQSAARLNHPNIVSVYDTGEEVDPVSQTSVPYIVMELVEGRTLREILREGRPILPRRALEFTVGVLDALAYSHRAGIVHRDIKPANVMLTSSGTIKVMDFGIARAVSDTSSTMTQTAAVIGTAQYLSPEQARGERVDSRSDIYSAGCLMYELLVGRPPFQGDSPVSVAYQHVREQPVPPSTLDAEVTAPMDAVVLKALAKDPDDRYASAAEMRDDVQRILGGQRVEATLPPPVPPLVATPQAPAPATAMLSADPPTAEQTAATGVVTDTLPESAQKNRSRLWWTLAIVALLVVGVIAAITLINSQKSSDPKQVAVPVLFRTTEQEARDLLTEAKLVPRVEYDKVDDPSMLGRVLKTDPVAGTPVPTGSTVVITVNQGPDMKSIPASVVGMLEDDAKRLLGTGSGGLGFTNVRAVEATDEPLTAKAGEVLSVDPPPGGEPVSVTTPITLRVATGQSPVPSLQGLTREEAKIEVERAGFKNYVFEPSASSGVVISTRPETGELADRTARLTIVLSSGSTPTPSATPKTTPPPSGSATPSATGEED
ncbi:MAG: Stk1 family PASTA domain-containing Ser/Thr kinase [Propioniciclava sp.]|uniref:Stk1 family PASTA domain-containing Ser/Thr kinase n=1 Tax=Propioniciclava sp. TaxID=2038686 RepID=UPI0039E44A07